VRQWKLHSRLIRAQAFHGRWAIVWRCLGMLFCCIIGIPNVTLAQCHFPTKGSQNVVTYRFQPEVLPSDRPVPWEL
jgi:hypothetical protein